MYVKLLFKKFRKCERKMRNEIISFNFDNTEFAKRISRNNGYFASTVRCGALPKSIIYDYVVDN